MTRDINQASPILSSVWGMLDLWVAVLFDDVQSQRLLEAALAVAHGQGGVAGLVAGLNVGWVNGSSDVASPLHAAL